MNTNDRGNGGSAHLSAPTFLRNAREQLESRTRKVQLPVTTWQASNLHQNYSRGEAALDEFLRASADKSRAVTSSTATPRTNATATMADFTQRVRLHPEPDLGDFIREDTRRAHQNEMRHRKSLSDIGEMDEEYEHDEDARMNRLEKMRENNSLSEMQDEDEGVIVRIPPGLASAPDSATQMTQEVSSSFSSSAHGSHGAIIPVIPLNFPQASSSRDCVPSPPKIDDNADEEETPSRVTSPWSNSTPSESKNISPVSFGDRSRSPSSAGGDLGDGGKPCGEGEDANWAITSKETIGGDDADEGDDTVAGVDRSVMAGVDLPRCEGQDTDGIATLPTLELTIMSSLQITMRAPLGLVTGRSEMGLPQVFGGSGNQVPGTATPIQAPPGLGRIALGFPVSPGGIINQNFQVEATGTRMQPPPGLKQYTTALPQSLIASNNQVPQFPDTRLALVRASHSLRLQTTRPPSGYENVVQINDAVPWFIRRLVTERNLPIDKILFGSQETVLNETWYVDYYRDVAGRDPTDSTTFVHTLEHPRDVPQRSPWRGKTSAIAHAEYVEEMRRRHRPVILRWNEMVGLKVEEEEAQDFVTLPCEGLPSGVWDVPILALKASINNFLRRYDSDLYPITSSSARSADHSPFYDIVLLNWRPFANKNGGVYQPQPQIRIDTPEKWHEILETCGDEHRGWFERKWREWAPKVNEEEFVGCSRCFPHQDGQGGLVCERNTRDTRRDRSPIGLLEYPTKIQTPDEYAAPPEWMARNSPSNPIPSPPKIPVTRSETTTSIPATAPPAATITTTTMTTIAHHASSSSNLGKLPQSPYNNNNNSHNDHQTATQTQTHPSMSFFPVPRNLDPFGMTMDPGVEDQVAFLRWRYEALIARRKRGGESAAMGEQRDFGDGQGEAMVEREGEGAKWHDGSERDDQRVGGSLGMVVGVIGEKRKSREGE